MTLRPARSDAIHCTRKRAENSACARSRARPTSRTARRTPRAGNADRARQIKSIRHLRNLRHALAAADQPPHAGEIEDADPEPVPQPVVRRAVTARPVDHVDIADGNPSRRTAPAGNDAGRRNTAARGTRRGGTPSGRSRCRACRRAGSRLRTPLAMRDCNFLNALALRPTRWPATSPMRGAARSSAASSAGMKDGSFCPSPSSVTTAARAPRRRRCAPRPTGRRRPRA